MSYTSPDLFVGQLGAPRGPIVDAYTQGGMKISEKSLPHIRAGRSPGNILRMRYLSSQAHVASSPAKKDQLYHSVALKATDPEIRKHSEREPDRYTSAGYVSKLSEGLGLPARDLDKILRVMRIEAAMSAKNGELPTHLLTAFNDVAQDFLDRYNNNLVIEKSPTLQMLFFLRDKPDFFKPDNFFAALYSGDSRRTIGSWTPYGADWDLAFYNYRLKDNPGFSSLDILVLEDTAKANYNHSVGRMIKETGIPADVKVMAIHRNALFGKI